MDEKVNEPVVLIEAVKSNCPHCGKEFMMDYFIVCGDCLTEMINRNQKTV